MWCAGAGIWGRQLSWRGATSAEGADEVTFLNITGFRDFPLGGPSHARGGALKAAACRTRHDVCCALPTRQGAINRAVLTVRQAPG